MNRIDKKFSEIKNSKRTALSIFLTAGYPSLSATEELVLSLSELGVDFFEIGFPFSDPIADGPTIQKSSEIALKNGITWKKILNLCKSIRKKSNVPLILMSYSNPLFCRGWKKSAHELSKAGFDGVIIPDMLPEESKELRKLFHQYNLSLIYLLAPTSSDERIKTVSKLSSGFIYAVSITGVTGTRDKLPIQNIQTFLKKVKRVSPVPVVLGFGISQPKQLESFRDIADGFVIGSAMIKVLDQKNRSGR